MAKLKNLFIVVTEDELFFQANSSLNPPRLNGFINDAKNFESYAAADKICQALNKSHPNFKARVENLHNFLMFGKAKTSKEIKASKSVLPASRPTATQPKKETRGRKSKAGANASRSIIARVTPEFRGLFECVRESIKVHNNKKKVSDADVIITAVRLLGYGIQQRWDKHKMPVKPLPPEYNIFKQ